MSLVKPLFVASIASLTLMMTSMSSTINLLQQMGILPTLGTCSNCSSPTGAYKSEGLLPQLQLQEEAVTAPEHLPQQQQHHLAWLCPSNVSVLQQSSHLQYCCKGNFPASTTEKVKVYTHKIVWHYKSCEWFLQILQLLNKLKCSKKWKC